MKPVLDFDLLASGGEARTRVFGVLHQAKGHYDPHILTALDKAMGVCAESLLKDVRIQELEEGMVFADDVMASGNRMLVARGQAVSPVMIQRLKNFARNMSIREPLKVIVPGAK